MQELIVQTSELNNLKSTQATTNGAGLTCELICVTSFSNVTGVYISRNQSVVYSSDNESLS